VLFRSVHIMLFILLAVVLSFADLSNSFHVLKTNIKSTRLPATIIETAEKSGNFKTLLAAVQAAGLIQELSAPGPITLFAPDDEAFAKLPHGKVDELLKDIPALKNILLFHLVPEKMSPSRNGRNTDTLLIDGDGFAKQLTVKIKNWELDTYIITGQKNIPQVTNMDIKCDNGLVHVVNEVLIPYESDLPPQISFIGSGDIEGNPSLQMGYYGSQAGTGRDGKKYEGPPQKFEKGAFRTNEAWKVAGNWDYEKGVDRKKVYTFDYKKKK